jgi:hypothetical protein
LKLSPEVRRIAVRLNLALAEERRFGSGTVYLYYRPA